MNQYVVFYIYRNTGIEPIVYHQTFDLEPLPTALATMDELYQMLRSNIGLSSFMILSITKL